MIGLVLVWHCLNLPAESTSLEDRQAGPLSSEMEWTMYYLFEICSQHPEK